MHAFYVGILLAAYGAQTDAAAWRENVDIGPVLADADAHSIHTYFVTSPESPDGRRVVFYRSSAADGHTGDVCVFDRKSQAVTVLAAGVAVEDVHRAACQQWTQDGRSVVFHDLREDRWCIVVVDVASGEERVVCRDRQLGWGTPSGHTVPLYGPHWDPGEHVDLELLDLRSGAIRTVVTAEAVRRANVDWIAKQFGTRRISIFFPILSPDESRVFFKLATPAGGHFRSGAASHRHGLMCYDVAEGKLLYEDARWGHPAWHPDSRRILNIRGSGLVLIDTEADQAEPVTEPRLFPGGHPSLSPDGRLFVTDARLETDGQSQAEWGVVVGEVATGKTVLVHRFRNDRGARSWRRSHPHPVFSPDGRRVYFNVSADRWTRLYAAEIRDE